MSAAQIVLKTVRKPDVYYLSDVTKETFDEIHDILESGDLGEYRRITFYCYGASDGYTAFWKELVETKADYLLVSYDCLGDEECVGGCNYRYPHAAAFMIKTACPGMRVLFCNRRSYHMTQLTGARTIRIGECISVDPVCDDRISADAALNNLRHCVSGLQAEIGFLEQIKHTPSPDPVKVESGELLNE